MSPDFLTLEEVLKIHPMQLERYGGGEGIRDMALLESALAQPAATFDGQLVHEDLIAMAAAYLFHIVSNHPFVDGNKRTGLLAALVFLDLNGFVFEHGSQALYALTMAIAEGRVDKAYVTTALRRIAYEF
ncbi:type II toxin-antitoxin system death-on-curing family toxin [Hyalangium sp.]|uniref:type II toxin-antitoxin system death-on-curing family toxin n=1 Tax=Hyalangium sp. TaxID=2028555 RepID=UPI002D6E9CC4|nr:type II toxin-antitoxin system death-on-curing family toxin [Hyalangium sp.]HYH98348.1 type II toxin-antitoxin system death-on-curing family toxin [Hyalangium sp.]